MIKAFKDFFVILERKYLYKNRMEFTNFNANIGTNKMNKNYAVEIETFPK